MTLKETKWSVHSEVMETRGYLCHIHTKKMETRICDIHTKIVEAHSILVWHSHKENWDSYNKKKRQKGGAFYSK